MVWEFFYRKMTKQDLRSIRSTKKIQQAFIDLLQEENFDQVKVSDIARRAEIDRQTFYLHYVDKYYLLAIDTGRIYLKRD